MNNIFERFDASYEIAIECVKKYTTINCPEYPQVTTLCKWLLEHPENIFYFVSRDFKQFDGLFDYNVFTYESLFMSIFSHYTGGSDMCFCYMNGESPKIIFKNQSDVIIDDYLTKNVIDLKNRFNLFVTEKGLKVPRQSMELKFLSTKDPKEFIFMAEEYIEKLNQSKL